MRWSRIAWAALVLAACAPGVGAAKLDKSACNLLNAELAGIVAAGARDDMERGPAWAKANLTPERLRNIQRLIKLEEQLEFRCGMRRKRIVAIEAHPPKGPKGKIVIPEGPQKKPAVTNAIKPRRDAKTSAHQKAAAASTATPKGKPVAAPSAAKSVETASTQPQAPARPTKSSRRRSSAAYVPPSDVNPFFVTRYGDAQ
jgi:hypothetical protein